MLKRDGVKGFSGGGFLQFPELPRASGFGRFGTYLKLPTLAFPGDFSGYLRTPDLTSTAFGQSYLKLPTLSRPEDFGALSEKYFRPPPTLQMDGYGQDAPGGYFDPLLDPTPPLPDVGTLYTDQPGYTYEPSADYTTTVQALQIQDVPAGDTGGFDWNALANRLIAAGPSAILLAERSGIINMREAQTLNNAVTGQGPAHPPKPPPPTSGVGTVAVLGVGALVALKMFL